MRREPEKLALVIPVLREVENLRVLLGAIRTALDATGIRYEILVVDDDSGDGTEELVGGMALEDPRIRLLVRRGERGLSGAIVHGWRHTDAAILGVMDGDLQHPPELLPELVQQMRAGHDMAIGSRYVRGGAVGRWNLVRRLISAAAVGVTLPLQRRRRWVKDPMSGYFLVRRRCVEQVAFQSAGFKLLLEILVRGRIGSICEVPFAFGHRGAGVSKAGLKVAWEYLVLLIKLYAEARRTGPGVREPGDLPIPESTEISEVPR